MKGKILGYIKKFLIITLGAIAYASATVFFIDPHNLAPGGVTGVAIIINRVCNDAISIGALFFIINVPLLITGLIKFGKEFLAGTVYGTVVLSGTIQILEMLRDNMLESGSTWFKVNDPLISCIAGGALMAIGLGLVFRVGATTGGTDIIVKLLRLKFRHIKAGRIFIILDTIIAFSSLPVVDWQVETVLYSLVAMFISSVVVDLVLYGPDGAKLVYIVSDRSETIAKRVLEELHIGATFLNGEGAYTMVKKEILMCAVKKHLFPKLKDIVTQEDCHAFLIVTSANEIYGEGYKSHFKEDV